MTTPTVTPDIDPRTREELTPPCEARVRRDGWKPCGRPAAWIIRVRNHNPSGDVALLCEAHYGNRGRLTCHHCGARMDIISSERL